MRSVPTDLAKNYSNLLGNKGIPPKNHYHFQKWLRYLDSVPVGVPQMAGAEKLSPLVRKIRKKPPRKVYTAAPGWAREKMCQKM